MHPMLWANDLRCVQKTCGDIYTCNHTRRLFICTAGIITPDNISRQQLLIQTSQIKEMQIVSRHYHLMISRIFPLESWATTLRQSRNPPPPWIPRPAPPLRPNFPSRKVSNTLGPDFVLFLQLPSYCACATLIPLTVAPSYKAVVLGRNVTTSFEILSPFRHNRTNANVLFFSHRPYYPLVRNPPLWMIVAPSFRDFLPQSHKVFSKRERKSTTMSERGGVNIRRNFTATPLGVQKPTNSSPPLLPL